MVTKELGKIENVRFGQCPDRPFLFGISLCLGWGSSGVWVSHYVNTSKNCNWDESDTTRQEESEKLMDYVDSLLKAAKVDEVGELTGKPIEVNDKGLGTYSCDDFRILSEVL